MELTPQQRSLIEDKNYGMFDSLGNYMVGICLLRVLKTKELTMETSMEEIVAIARGIGDEFPDTEASDTAVREAIVGLLIDIAEEKV
jgi:hypothetical protein